MIPSGRLHLFPQLSTAVRLRMHSIILVLLMAVFLPALSWGAAASEVPERKIVAKVIAAYGGEAALRNIRTVSARGRIDAARAGEGSYARYFGVGRKLRVELVYRESAETRVLNGEKGWRGVDGGPLLAAKGAPLLAMVYQYKYLAFPLPLLEEGYRITSLGGGELHGVPVEILAVSDDEGPPMKVFVDARTHLIVRVAGAFALGEARTELAVEFSDFRKVEGVMFPFRLVNYGGEFRIGDTVITGLQVNGAMDAALFAPGTSGEEPVRQ